jgi:hypothetical protein
VAAGPSTARRRSRRPGRGRRCRSRVGQWEVGGGPGPPGGAGRGGRACPPSDQAGQAGVRSARRGRLRGGHECRLQREVAAAAAWLPSSGWVLDHAVWSSPSLTAGWADPEGPGEVPAGMGVRPQRGPSRQRAGALADGSALTCDAGVVGLPGLEPGTSSLAAKCREPLCARPFLQVAPNRRCQRYAFNPSAGMRSTCTMTVAWTASHCQI